MNEFILILVALVMVMGVRLVPSFLFPVVGTDEGFHLLLRREIRHNGFRVPKKTKACVFEEQWNYPWLYHQLIAFLPEAWLRRVPALPSAIIDGLHMVLAFMGGAWLAAVLGHPEVGKWAGFWSAVFFGVNPALLAHGMGPRAYEITPRPLGEFLFSMATMSAIWAVSGSGGGWWAVAAFAGGALLLSSKFGAQVLIFFTLFLALVPGFGAVLWGVPGAFLAAMLLSRGRYWHILRGQIAHLGWFRRKQQYFSETVSGRNRWQDVQMVWASLSKHGLFSAETVRAAGHVYATNTYLLVLSRGGLFMLLIVMCALAGRGGDPRLGGLPVLGLLAWAWVWIVPFVLTSTKHFRFLGEAERYAEYSILPTAILVGVGLAILPTGVWLLVFLLPYAVSAIGVMGHAWAIHARVARTANRNRAELVEALRALPAGALLLGIPAMQVLAPVASLLPHRYVDISPDVSESMRIMEQRYDGYPWPKPDWDMWRSLGVDYVVMSSPEKLRAMRPGIPYDQIPWKQIFSNPSYRVFAHPNDRVAGNEKRKAIRGESDAL